MIFERRSRVHGTASLKSTKSVGEKLLHGGVVKQNTTKNGSVPQIVAPSDVVKHARAPSLRDLAGVDHCAAKVHQDGLCNRRVEAEHKF